MSTARPAQGIDVRRLYTRFMLLVVLPTLGLIGFGVVAIHNERAVVEERYRSEYTRRLRVLAEHLVTTLQTEANRLARGTTPTGTSELVRFEFNFEGNRLTPSRSLDPHLADALTANLEAYNPPKNGAVTLLPISVGAARGLYAVRQRADGSLVGIAFSELGMRASVKREGGFQFPSDPARFILEGPSGSPAAAVNPLLALLRQDSDEQGTVSFPLPGALADWRITAELPGDDPIRAALWRNRSLYIITLLLCVTILASGVVFTLQSIWREAKLSRMRTDFVSNISHELRTPLASIRMFAETLRSGRARTSEDQLQCVEFITRESERLSAIAERTLDWARIEAGRKPYDMKQVPTQPLVQGVLDLFLARGSLALEAFSITYGADLPDVRVDAAAFGQVLMNLLENAVKYSGANRRIQVRVNRRGKSIVVEVEDNGIGISRKDARRIFERFYRADDLLARQTEGTGLGLSIARKIVEEHDGRLTLQSEPGHGSIFTVELPAVVSASSRSVPKESLA